MSDSRSFSQETAANPVRSVAPRGQAIASATAEVTALITNASLKSSTVKDLGELAKSHGLSGWHAMKKDQLIRALLKVTRKPVPKPAAKATKTARAAVASAKPPALAKTKNTTSRQASRITAKRAAPASRSADARASDAKSSRAARKIHAVQEKKERLKDLSGQLPKDPVKGADRDRIVLLVRDSYWLHVMWQVTRTAVARAQAAMAEHWHTARPVLRLIEVDAGPTTSTAEQVVREIEVHGGVQNWYIDVQAPPHSYRVDLGYRSANGKFFSVARSNMVTTPAPGASDSIDENWKSVAQDYEKIYALSGGYNEERSSGELQELFEERLRRPMGPASARYGMGADRLINRHKGFRFDIDAEMIIFGTTSPDARVTLGGEPVKLRADGTFTVRMAMPDKRQVIPAVAASADGVEQRTVVLAVERNTKVLEPMVKEQNDS
jgi:hypothetical protein